MSQIPGILRYKIVEYRSMRSMSTASRAAGNFIKPATQIQRELKSKAREALVKDIQAESTSKNLPAAFIRKNKKTVDDLYEVQTIKSSAHIFREMRNSGQIQNSFDPLVLKAQAASAANASTGNQQQTHRSWMPAAIVSICAITGISWGLSQQGSSEADALPIIMTQPFQASVQSSLPPPNKGLPSVLLPVPVQVQVQVKNNTALSTKSDTSVTTSIIHVPVSDQQPKTEINKFSQQPMWLQRPRSG